MESVADELVAKVKAAVDKLSVGRPEVPPRPAPQQDPQQDSQHGSMHRSRRFLRVPWRELQLVC